MSAVVLQVPADRVEWGPLHSVGNTCWQQGACFQGDELVCQLTVQWPAALPVVPVLCATQGRHGGPQD